MDWSWFPTRLKINRTYIKLANQSYVEKNPINNKKCIVYIGSNIINWCAPRQYWGLLFLKCYFSIVIKWFQNQKSISQSIAELTWDIHGKNTLQWDNTIGSCGWLHSSDSTKHSPLCQAIRWQVDMGNDTIEMLGKAAWLIWIDHRYTIVNW